MRIVKLAAGIAVGYVLGARAGRERYERIAATARKVSENPTVVQARHKAMGLLAGGTTTAVDERPTQPVVAATGKPRPPHSRPVNGVTVPAVAGDPVI
ncbi:hypothetical protein [Paractinoplanes durhamensis]|uniref:Protoporphyrinogen oxidase n=1 Tax=Paractinoplanes durhamensis TaxID=113563 RepID=A0ABQ3YU48_9ACTN|nr:hypothetical protein [Actinoplanes durhamensis]GIE01121.1 hypothetical protein Adu01nite_24710 [Actinoplanes durhamensis]